MERLICTLQDRGPLLVRPSVGLRASLNGGAKAAARVRKNGRRKRGTTGRIPARGQAESIWLHGARDAFEEFVGRIPRANGTQRDDPARRCTVIVKDAAIKAAVLSGGLSLPPGPFGILTIIPDLLGIWRIHDQMVAEVAGAYGRRTRSSQQQMMSCLFKHAFCQLTRDLVVRLLQRALAGRASLCLLQRIAVPILGAAAVAAYTYFDTLQVGKRAIVLFGQQARGEKKAKASRRRRPSLIHVNGHPEAALRVHAGLTANRSGVRKTRTSLRLPDREIR
jgi:uncharacterized protein (DUF697 family)